MNEQLHTRVEEENDFLDAVVGFGVSFAFYMGLGIIAMILQYVLSA